MLIMAMAATGPTTAPAIQALEGELEDALALGCGEDVPVDGEVLDAGVELLDEAGDADALAEAVIVVSTVVVCLSSTVLYIEEANHPFGPQMTCVSAGELLTGNC